MNKADTAQAERDEFYDRYYVNEFARTTPAKVDEEIRLYLDSATELEEHAKLAPAEAGGAMRRARADRKEARLHSSFLETLESYIRRNPAAYRKNRIAYLRGMIKHIEGRLAKYEAELAEMRASDWQTRIQHKEK